MSPLVIFLITLVVALFLAAVFYRVKTELLHQRISQKWEHIRSIYLHKIDKIPAIVETIRKYAKEDEIYREILSVHRLAVISKNETLYDILELDARISREFRFLMKLSARISPLLRDGNFVYARDFWMFYEKSIKKEFNEYNELVRRYEQARRSKNQTIIGLLIPIERIPKIPV